METQKEKPVATVPPGGQVSLPQTIEAKLVDLMKFHPSQIANLLLQLEKKKGTPKLAAALAKAQGQYEPVKRSGKVDYTDRKNRRINYTYATLDDIWNVIRKPFSGNGLSIVSYTAFRDNSWLQITELHHESGESKSSELPINAKQAPQALGSDETYFKKYELAGLAGVPGGTEDDGLTATENFNERKEQRPPQQQNRQQDPPRQQQSRPNGQRPQQYVDGAPRPPVPREPVPVTQGQLSHLEGVIHKSPYWNRQDAKEFCRIMFGKDFVGLYADQFQQFLRALNQERPENAIPGHPQAAQ